MIAAMNRGMAIHAATIGDPVAFTRSTHQPRTVVQGARMPRVYMTTLAQVGHLGDLQLGVVRAVSLMANVAILSYRSMLPEKGAALFGMTGIALVIDRRFKQHALGR